MACPETGDRVSDSRPKIGAPRIASHGERRLAALRIDLQCPNAIRASEMGRVIRGYGWNSALRRGEDAREAWRCHVCGVV